MYKRQGYVRDVALEPVRCEMTAVFSQEEGLPFDEALAKQKGIPAAKLVQDVYKRQNLHRPEALTRQIGCVIGTHAGPGAFGLAFFDEALVIE